MPLTVCVIGLGLIGGSLCKALKQFTPCRVLGMDADARVCAQALEEGAVDALAGTSAALHEADALVLALYPAACMAFMEANIGALRPTALVLDVCGVKTRLAAYMEEKLAGTRMAYIGTHPMAGKEVSGYRHATALLFQGANIVLTPGSNASEAALQALEAMLRALGFARICYAPAQAHDAVIAYTSQLPHVVASSYVNTEAVTRVQGFTGGSFEDMSRVATCNEDMWTELFLDNREALLPHIDTLVANLRAFREALAAGDDARVRALLHVGNEAKEKLSR